MFAKIKQKWNELKKLPPGTRFEKFHEQQREQSRWVKVAYLGGALVSFAIGVILAFIPGPAVVFFALTGALIATQSRWAAKQLDRGELKGRELWERFQTWRNRRRAERRRRQATARGS
jgi:hypothetical protein